MNRPNFFHYIVGNPLSTMAAIGFSGYLIYRWWTGQADGGVVVIAVFVFGTAMNSNQKVTDYGNWKRSWNAMGGTSGWIRWRWLKKPAAVLIWVGGAFALTQLDPRQPQTQLAIAGYTMASALLVIVLLYRLVRRWWRRRPRKIVPVAISLPVPRQSPGPKQFDRDVPEYCYRLG